MLLSDYDINKYKAYKETDTFEFFIILKNNEKKYKK